jgi:hypothetical protein
VGQSGPGNQASALQQVKRLEISALAHRTIITSTSSRSTFSTAYTMEICLEPLMKIVSIKVDTASKHLQGHDELVDDVF